MFRIIHVQLITSISKYKKFSHDFFFHDFAMQKFLFIVKFFTKHFAAKYLIFLLNKTRIIDFVTLLHQQIFIIRNSQSIKMDAFV